MFTLLKIDFLLNYLFNLFTKGVVFICCCRCVIYHLVILIFSLQNTTVLIFYFRLLLGLKVSGTITSGLHFFVAILLSAQWFGLPSLGYLVGEGGVSEHALGLIISDYLD